MAAFIRRQFSGASRNTTTTTLLGVAGTSVDIAATTGWPSIAGVPFYVVINPSSIYEEKCLATISGSTLTLVRAQDDTTASEHPIGSVIYPVFTANDADEANELVSKLTTKGDLLVTDGSALHRLGVGANGFFLKANSSASVGLEWASIPTINSLDDVGDVTITDLEGGDILTYDSSASAWVNETVHFLTVSDSEPNDEVQEGDLWYNSSELELYTYYSGSWIQVTLTPEFPTVEELDNVYISTANTGDVLAFDGNDWYNDTVTNLLGGTINATTAETLETARVISLSGDVSGSVSFDGSQDVSISATVQINSIALGTDTTGNYMSDLTQGTGVTITHTPGEGSNATIAIGQAVGTSASVTFAAVTAPVVGNASTASTLETARTISLTGDVSGSVSFNGSADASITATIQPNSVALGTDTTGDYMSGVSVGTALTVSHTPGEGSTATIGLDNAQLSNFLIDGVSGNSYGLIGTSAYLDVKNTNGYNKEIELDISAVETQLTTDGYLKDSSTSSSVSFARLQTSGDVVVGGDLTVNGTTTTLNTETLLVEDNIVVLNSGITGSPTLNSGIEVERGTSDNVSLRWNETSDKWEITEDGSAYLEIGTTADISAAALTSLSDLPDVSTAYQIGATGPAGGIIFITPDTIGNSTGKYFEVAPSASQVQRSWSTGGNQSLAVSGADATGLGFGAQNTIDIVAQSGNVSATSAAAYASGYEYGGFSDWFLPSIDELQELYAVEALEAGTIPGLLSNNHWSSTEYSATQAEYQNLGDGGQGFSAKSNSLYVRPVRAFDSPASGDFLKWNGSYWTNDPINLGTDTVGNFVNDITAGTGITVTHTPGEGSSASIALNATLDNLSDVVIASPIQFQGLMYDGTNWVNSNIPDVYLVRNNTGSTIPKGTLVGAVGAEPSGRIDVAPFEVTGTENSELRAMGIVTSNISSGVNGAVMSFGTLTGLDTRGDTASALAVGDETWAAGDILFAHPTVAGKLTNIKPQHDLAVAFITVRHASAGQIAVRIIPGNNHLEWMHDVVLSSPTDGQFLRYNSASTVWVNDAINLGTDTVGNYMSDLTQGTGVTITHTPGEGSNATIGIGQAVATTSSVTFANVTSTGNVTISGRIDKTTVRESVADVSVSASAVTANYATGDIFYLETPPSSNFALNLTNAPTDNGKAITVVLFVTQGATGYYPDVVKVAGVEQEIKWANFTSPTPSSGNAGVIDIFSFTFVRRSSAWTVFGSSNLGYSGPQA